MKKLLSLMALFVVSLLTISMVSAYVPHQDLEIVSVKVNDEQIYSGQSIQKLAVEEGQKLSIRVGLQNLANAKISDLEVDAKISGYKESSNYASLEDSTTLFDINNGVVKYVNLEVSLPNDLKNDEDYSLRIRVTDQKSVPLTVEVSLQFEAKRHGVEIADVVFAPSTSVKAGRSLLTTVLLENFGEKTEKDVKVTVAIPELSISATEFVDSLASDNVEYEDVPEMFLPIPAATAAGDYQVKVTVDFNNMKDTITKTYKITVLANEQFPISNKLVLAVGPETQPVTIGKTATYGVALTNAGSTSKAYMLNAVAGDWATVSISESLVVLEAGKNKVVYIEVTPNTDATAGEHVLSLSVKSGSDVLETVALKATVISASQNASGQTFNLRNGLEIALIILVVLLVIIGLIIGFSRLKKDNEDEKTYY